MHFGLFFFKIGTSGLGFYSALLFEDTFMSVVMVFQAPNYKKKKKKSSFELLNVLNRKVTFLGFDAFQTSETG